MTNRGRWGVALCVVCGGLALLLSLPLLLLWSWKFEREQWLRSGASLPIAFVEARPLYVHLQPDLCSEALFRIDDAEASRIQRDGLAYLNGLGSNRRGDVLTWHPLPDSAQERVRWTPSPLSGPNCQAEAPPDGWGQWPALPEDLDLGSAYGAIDQQGDWLIIYPEQRLAYFWSS